MNKEQRRKFMELASRLSPENLSCDGEISRAQTERRYRECMREWRELERQVGTTVSEDEVWNWVIEDYKNR